MDDALSRAEAYRAAGADTTGDGHKAEHFRQLGERLRAALMTLTIEVSCEKWD